MSPPPCVDTPYCGFYILVMRAWSTVSAMFLMLVLVGCQSQPYHPTDPGEGRMFGAVSMRIHPIFTQVRDWTGDGKPDGIEALLEFQDQFGDPTKAMGTVMFELYGYRRGYPDPRGERIVNPWIGSLMSLQQQQEHWNRTSRTYSFQLAFPGIRTDRPYVLTAQFDRSAGGRFFDRIILEPAQQTSPAAPATPPTAGRAASPPSATTAPAAKEQNGVRPIPIPSGPASEPAASAPATEPATGTDAVSRPTSRTSEP